MFENLHYFDVLLTVHLSTILVIILLATELFFNFSTPNI